MNPDDDLERRLMAALDVDPAVTSERWIGLPEWHSKIQWPRMAVLAIQHRVEGLVVDAVATLQAEDLVPPSTWTMLRHRTRLASARTEALITAVERVQGLDSTLFEHLILYKGMTMVGRFRKTHHRMVSDLDAVIHESQMDHAREALGRAGFVEKQGFRGSSFYAEPDRPQIGVDHVMFDLHFEPLPRFDHGPARNGALRDASREPFALAEGVTAVRFGIDESVLIALVYLAEHAASWIHVCLEDDVRLVKALDIELLCADRRMDATRVASLARTWSVLGSAVMGAAWVRMMRGQVPHRLQPILDGRDVDDLLDLIALPDGHVARWTVPAAERAFRSDRPALALGMAPGGRGRLKDWYDPKNLLPTARERVWEITDQANERCGVTR